jgi:hypothetical protein
VTLPKTPPTGLADESAETRAAGLAHWAWCWCWQLEKRLSMKSGKLPDSLPLVTIPRILLYDYLYVYLSFLL